VREGDEGSTVGRGGTLGIGLYSGCEYIGDWSGEEEYSRGVYGVKVIMARSGVHQGGESKEINRVRSIIDRGGEGKELKHLTNGDWSAKGSTIGTRGYSGNGPLFMR